MEEIYRAMFEFVRAELAQPLCSAPQRRQFPFRDRYQHTRRVFGWAQRLLKEVPADPFLTLTAAIFHDSGFSRMPNDDHALASAELCRGYLARAGYDAHTISRVGYLVAMHSEKKRPLAELSDEMRVLIDADLLDEVGGLCVLWDSMDEGTSPVQSYEKTYRRLEKAYHTLNSKQDRMRTAPGLRIYQENLRMVRGFLDHLRYELCLDESV